jgi:hypothetical protein
MFDTRQRIFGKTNPSAPPAGRHRRARASECGEADYVSPAGAEHHARYPTPTLVAARHQPDATTQSPQRGEEARRERRSMPYLASGLLPSLLLAGWISPPVVESPRSFCRGPALTCGGERGDGGGTWEEREAEGDGDRRWHVEGEGGAR